MGTRNGQGKHWELGFLGGKGKVRVLPNSVIEE